MRISCAKNTIVQFTDDGVFTLVRAATLPNGFHIAVTDTKPPANFTDNQICASQKIAFQGQKKFQCEGGAKTGRYVVIRFKNQDQTRNLSLCEVAITRNSEY